MGARRNPEQDPQHQVLSRHLLTFFDQTDQAADGAGLPAFVKKDLLRYLVQGRIALGPKVGWRVTRFCGHPVLLLPGPRTEFPSPVP